MNSPRPPPTGLRAEALKKLLRMDPQTRDLLLRNEALRRGLNGRPRNPLASESSAPAA